MNLRERLLSHTVVYRTLKQTLLPAASEQVIVDRLFAAGPGARVLDLGCGYGDYARHFAGRCRYVGVDHNADYLDTARRINDGLDVEFICADVNDPVVAAAGPYDLVILGGVLHHLDDGTVSRLVASVADLLTPAGRLVAVEPVFDPDQSLPARLLIAADRGRHVRDAAGYARLLRPALPRLRSEVHRDLLRVPYTHLFIQAGLATPEGDRAAEAELALATGDDPTGELELVEPQAATTERAGTAAVSVDPVDTPAG